MVDARIPTRDERWREIDVAEETPASQILLLRSFVCDFPDSVAAWRRLGQRLVDVSRFDEALQALEKAQSVADPAYLVFIYCAMGNLFREKGDDAAAEQWYRQAINQCPDDTHGYIHLGCFYARRGRLAEAETVHRQGTLCKKGFVDEAYYNLGLVLRAQERFEEALACFQRALEMDPQYKVARVATRDVKGAAAMLRSPPGPAA